MSARKLWKPVYIGKSSTTHEAILKTGAVWTKTESAGGAVSITRYPSAGYMEHYLLGENTGAKLREWDFY